MELDAPGVFIREISTSAPAIASAPTSVTGFVGSFATGPVGVPTFVHSLGQFKQRFGADGVVTEASVAVNNYFANGGKSACIVRALALPRPPTVGQLVAALNSLTPKPGAIAPVQLLCMPDMARRTDPFSQSDYDRLVRSAAMFCTEHRIFLLVDPNVAGDSMADVEAWLSATAAYISSNAAVYVPRLFTESSKLLPGHSCGPSGVVAGVIARIDATRGVWKAPAGRDAGVAGEPTSVISDQEQSPLNRQGINAIRPVERSGTVIWGSRTSGGSIGHPYRFVAARRLALFVENSLTASLQWVRDQDGSDHLWAQIRLCVSAFLEQLWRQGALQGRTPAEAFYVSCDTTTMTRVDVRRGRTIVQVGLAALKPADFVVVDLVFERR